jgi:hypothetical protein
MTAMKAGKEQFPATFGAYFYMTCFKVKELKSQFHNFRNIIFLYEFIHNPQTSSGVLDTLSYSESIFMICSSYRVACRLDLMLEMLYALHQFQQGQNHQMPFNEDKALKNLKVKHYEKNKMSNRDILTDTDAD